MKKVARSGESEADYNLTSIQFKLIKLHQVARRRRRSGVKSGMKIIYRVMSDALVSI